MRRILKRTLILIFVLLIAISTVSFGLEVDVSGMQKEKRYRIKEFNFFGIKLLYGDEMFFSGENDNVSAKQKNTNNIMIAGISLALVIYWISLLLIFEKEDKPDDRYGKLNDIDLLKKYNPMIAGCLTDNRQALPRDVIAIILNLIQKEYINMEMFPTKVEGKEDYIYMISLNKDKNKELDKLDKLEIYVLNWIFGFYEQERVDFVKKLKEISKRKEFLKNINKLNNLAEKELHKIGANIYSVPKELRILNVLIMLFTFVFTFVHIINNGVNVHIYQTTIFLFLFIVACMIIVIPIVALTIHLILFLIVILKRTIKSTTERYSGKHIVQMSFLVLIFMSIMLLVIYMIVPDKYICLDIFMIGMSILIVKTDNLMTKHNKKVLNDYYALRDAKKRIAEYTLIKDEQINYIKIWDEYLIYAVAFGIPIPIINKLKNAYKEDEDIKYLLKCENLYYICKAYLEIMWDMEFKKGTNIFGIDNLFELYNNDEK